MAWSPQQEEALKAVGAWLKTPAKSRKKVFRLDGFAGTGKTTLAKHMADMVKNGPVAYGTLAGKAASVLRSKGCAGAQTIHSMIYKPVDREKTLASLTKQFGAKDPQVVALKAEIERDKRHGKSALTWKLQPREMMSGIALLVLDEVSMVGEDIGNDLMSFDIPILAIGDPAQLPPIEGGGFFQQGKPDILLTEIHRQAKGNPIIDMATRVRGGDLLSYGDYGEGNRLIPAVDYKEVMDEAEQVLCGTNKMRQKFNRAIRKRLGAEDDMPMVNDRIICLSNDKENKDLMNGTLWYVGELLNQDANQIKAGIRRMQIWSDEDEENQKTAVVTVTDGMFETKSREEIAEFRRLAGFHIFDYGYAITVHKAQGSQWDNVVVYDDSWNDRTVPNFKQRWLYTAITRAAKTVTIIR